MAPPDIATLTADKERLNREVELALTALILACRQLPKRRIFGATLHEQIKYFLDEAERELATIPPDATTPTRRPPPHR